MTFGGLVNLQEPMKKLEFEMKKGNLYKYKDEDYYYVVLNDKFDITFVSILNSVFFGEFVSSWYVRNCNKIGI